MKAPIEMASAMTVAFAAAVAFYPALGWERRSRLAALAVLWPVAWLTPCLVSLGHPFWRFLAGVWGAAMAAKAYDAHVGVGLGVRPGVRDYVAFLPNLTRVVYRLGGAAPRLDRAWEWKRLAFRAPAAAAAFALGAAVFAADWSARPFAVEHAVKAVVFLLVLVAAANALASALRLLGVRTRDAMRDPFVAATPTEFWFRYNRVAQEFFYEDVFRRVGGRRAPVPALLVTFAVSALAHEALFVVTIGRVRGLQTAFFLLQGLAVAATLRVRPSGWRRAAWMAATYAFMIASSVLFFECLNDVVPFYARRGA